MSKASRSAISKKIQASPSRANASKAPAVAPASEPKEPARKLSRGHRVKLYASSRHLTSDVKEACGLKIKLATYFKDPAVGEAHPDLDRYEIAVDWEPNLSDGPTSARFAVVDYNADTGLLTDPAVWSEQEGKYVERQGGVAAPEVETPRFRQVSVWANLQRALEFFEEGKGLGRRIPWAFEGNRLVVVPHAGVGENAFYDRESKSLQFYYIESKEKTVYACLSTDIITHEFGHAVLDGIRPYYNESVLIQTAAFHEFMGDLSAILFCLRNNEFRGWLARETNGRIADASLLASIATQFGEAAIGKPYLRTALNKDKLSGMKAEKDPHRLSQVLLGAMFDVLREIAGHFESKHNNSNKRAAGNKSGASSASSPTEIYAWAMPIMQVLAIQPLDFLPPADVTFRDYAMAVCRAQRLSNPTDPDGLREMLINVFVARGILDHNDRAELNKPRNLYERMELNVYLDIDQVSRSRAAAYRFLDDNREDLCIPAFQDFSVVDLYDSNKTTEQHVRLPRQIVIEYLWREDVRLEGRKYREWNGQSTTMLCGGTLVVDDNGNVLEWARKPGSLPYGKPNTRQKKEWVAAMDEGKRRREDLLAAIADRIAAGDIGKPISTEKGLLAAGTSPILAIQSDGTVRFRMAPDFRICGERSVKQDVPRSITRLQIPRRQSGRRT
jgi:hypothetical protein